MKMSTAITVCLCLKLFKGCVCSFYSGINQKQLFMLLLLLLRTLMISKNFQTFLEGNCEFSVSYDCFVLQSYRTQFLIFKSPCLFTLCRLGNMP